MDISVPTMILYFIIASSLALVADVPESLGGIYFASKVFLYALLLASLLAPLRYSLIFLLMIATVCQDVTQTQTEGMEQGVFVTASMWQGGIGFLRPGWFMIAYCLALLLKGRIYLRDKPPAVAAFWYFTVPVMTGLVYGGFSTNVAHLEVPIDLKLPLFLLVSILLFRSYLREHPEALGAFAAAFLACILARHLLDFTYWLIGIGTHLTDVNRVSVDSTKATAVFMLLFGMVLIMRQKRFLIGGALGVVGGVLLVVYSSRGPWVSAVLGIVLLLFLMQMRRSLLVLTIMALLAYGSFKIMMVIQPENVELALKRVDRITLPGPGNLLEKFEPNRYAEMVNAADITAKRWAVLWGNGYGSFYTQSVIPFPSNMQDAFPEYSLQSGRFYTLHHYVLRTLFEHGIIGFIIISALWVIPGWHCFKVFRNIPSSLFSSFVLALMAFLPTSMLEMSWTGKGMIISGFVIAFCMQASEQWRRGEEPGKKGAMRALHGEGDGIPVQGPKHCVPDSGRPEAIS